VPKKLIPFIIVFCSLLMASLACRFISRADPTATPVPAVETAEEVVVLPTDTPTPEPTEEIAEIVTEEVVEEEEIEEVATPGRGVVEGMEKSMWIQEDSYVYVAFLYENESRDILYEDVMFSISLFDESGKLLYDEYINTPWLFPEQTVGMFSSVWLEVDMSPVASVTATFSYENTTEPGELVHPFTTEGIVYWPDDGYGMVTGRIVNNEEITFTNLQVYAICYDTAGEIVGGGFTYVDFIHLDDYMGFTMYVDTIGEVDSVEVFPMLSYSTQFIDKTDFLTEIIILDDYFYPNEWGYLVGGFTLRNETADVLNNSLIYVTFYDAQLNITATSTSYIDLLLPGDTLGIAPWVSTPPRGAETVEYDILILPGEPVDDYELDFNPFRVDSTTVTGDFEDYVLVNFTNTYNKEVSDLDVYVLVYNADGRIIGGGWDWTRESIPAGDSFEIEVWVSYADAETIDRVEAWVVPTFWTEFE